VERAAQRQLLTQPGTGSANLPVEIKLLGRAEPGPWITEVDIKSVSAPPRSDWRAANLSGVCLPQPRLPADSIVTLLKLQDVFGDAVGELAFRGTAFV
jgi:hypothetical protein